MFLRFNLFGQKYKCLESQTYSWTNTRKYTSLIPQYNRRSERMDQEWGHQNYLKYALELFNINSIKYLHCNYSTGNNSVGIAHPLKLRPGGTPSIPGMIQLCETSQRVADFLWPFEVGNFDQKMTLFSEIMSIFSSLGGDRATFMSSNKS